MPLRTTKFLGIAVGAMVSLTALQAGQSASLGPVAWGVDPGGGGGGSGPPMAPNATFSIVLESAASPVVAPHAQWFSVGSISGFTPAAPGSGNVYDPQAHEITWIWSFGDPGSAPHPAANLPTAWRDTNTAYGKRVAHVFDGPGTFTVTCWAFDQDGHYGVATTTITVQDPAAAYPGPRTICVNPNGDTDFTGAPAGAQQVQISGLQAAIESLGGQTCRHLFKAGATFIGDVPTAFNLANCYYGRYGTGADPILRPSPTSDGTMFGQRGSTGNKFVSLDYLGRWDAETETGNYASFGYIMENSTPLLIHKCRIRNSDGLAFGMQVTISATLIENWRGFAMISAGTEGPDQRPAVIGSAMHCTANVCQGQLQSFFESKLGNQNGPVRWGMHITSFYSCSSFFSNTGWSANGNSARPLTERNSQAIQDSMRLGSDPYTSSVLHCTNMERIVCEGPGISLMQRNSSNAQPSNFVLDKVILLGTSDALGSGFFSITGGTTVRNMFVWHPNVPVSRVPNTGFIRNGINNTNGAANRRVRIYGCTFYSALTSANLGYADSVSLNMSLFQPEGTAFTDLIQENNVVHCPVQNTALVAAAPVQLVAIPGLTTIYRGPRWNFPPVRITLGANVPVGGTVTFPYPNDTGQHPNGRATNQSYFTSPAPGLGEHMLGMTGQPAILPNDGLPIRSARGEFSVTFGASNITVTNTSGVTWPSGRSLDLLLDRRNDIGPPLSAFTSPTTVEVPLPIAGSPALAAAGVGLVPIDDLFGGRRPGEMRNNGAVVNGTATQGARDPATMAA